MSVLLQNQYLPRARIQERSFKQVSSMYQLTNSSGVWRNKQLISRAQVWGEKQGKITLSSLHTEKSNKNIIPS